MRGMDEYRSTTNWSYTSDQRLEPIRTTATTAAAAAAITTAVVVKANNPNLIYRRRNVSRTTTVTSSPPSYMLSTGQYGKISEKKRKERIMSYNAYAIEGKMKASIRSTFRWVKNKYSSIVHGY